MLEKIKYCCEWYDENENTIIIIFIFILMIFTILFAVEMYDFYKDYQCSTTTDLNWFVNNHCEKYF